MKDYKCIEWFKSQGIDAVLHGGGVAIMVGKIMVQIHADEIDYRAMLHAQTPTT